MTSYTIDGGRTRPGSGDALLADRFRVVRQLGQGGMGSVWLAEDTQLDNKQFAIKMLPSILVSNKRAYAQLKSEALVAMRLVHPNIVQIRAFEENDGNPFLVMDYIDGQTLDDYLADRETGIGNSESVVRNGGSGTENGGASSFGGLSEDEVVRILRPIAAALDYAHSQGVVHRDVKPGNVMIRKDGTPFILDFGIAREIQETMTRVTGKFSSGTLLYMSPEQLNGESPKPAQDVYSFAAMAYECLKGEPPFAHGQIEFQIMNKAPEPLAGGPRSCVPAIMAGLAKTPEGRPSTCAGVLAVREAAPRQRVVVQKVAVRATVQRPSPAESSHRVGPSAVENKVEGGLPLWKPIAAVAGVLFVAIGIWWLGGDGAPKNKPRSTVWQAPPVPDKPKLAMPGEDGSSVNAIWLEAGAQKYSLGAISGDDGFQSRKSTLFKSFESAKSLYEAKQWSKAAVALTNFVAGCKDLAELDKKRNVAIDSRRESASAKARAISAEAEQYASVRWQTAGELHSDAVKKFGRMEFDEAAKGFGLAIRQFDLCVSEAEKEHNRRAREKEAEAERQRQAREKEAEAERLRKQREKEAEAERLQKDQLQAMLEKLSSQSGSNQNNGGSKPVYVAEPAARPAPAQPTIRRQYQYEVRLAPYVIEGGMRKYVPASSDGTLPNGMYMRREERNGRYEIVIGSNYAPEGLIRFGLTYGGKSAKKWISSSMFNSGVEEIQLK